MNQHRGSDFNQFLIEEEIMTPTPRTDAIAHRGYGPTAYIAEMTGLARQLERELAELRKNTSELIASLQTETDSVERELAAERALADRLADALENSVSWDYAKPAFDAWREARHGTR